MIILPENKSKHLLSDLCSDLQFTADHMFSYNNLILILCSCTVSQMPI